MQRGRFHALSCFEWQHIAPDQRSVKAPTRSPAIVSQLEGFEAPAAAWESEILPARVSGYEPAWLDDLCLRRPRGVDASAKRPSRTRSRQRTESRSRRRRSRCSRAGISRPGQRSRKPADAQALGSLRARKPWPDSAPSMAHRSSTRSSTASVLPRTFIEEALGELVAMGLVNSDGFSGLRALLLPSDRRKPLSGGRAAGARRCSASRTPGAGR